MLIKYIPSGKIYIIELSRIEKSKFYIVNAKNLSAKLMNPYNSSLLWSRKNFKQALLEGQLKIIC